MINRKNSSPIPISTHTPNKTMMLSKVMPSHDQFAHPKIQHTPKEATIFNHMYLTTIKKGMKPFVVLEPSKSGVLHRPRHTSCDDPNQTEEPHSINTWLKQSESQARSVSQLASLREKPSIPSIHGGKMIPESLVINQRFEF
jgi:hypothetical protein